MTTTAMLRFRFAAALTVAACLWLALPGCGSKSSSVTAPTVSSPASPANLQVAPGDQSNSVSWNASSGATSYNLYFKLGPGASKADSKLTGVVSPYTHGSLANGTLYSYVVTAQNSVGESGASAGASATPSPGPVYVSVSTGNDVNDGRRATPVKTLLRAYQVTSATSSTVILMEAGAYAETPNFLNGVDVHGGYDLPGWIVGSSLTSFTNTGGGYARADATNAPTAISGIEIKGSSATPGNSIALYAVNCLSSLVFTNCRFVSGLARPGAAGADGAAGPSYGPGQAGANGSCDGLGGAGGFAGPGLCGGGAGGQGGLPTGVGNGFPGLPGGCFGGSGGAGGGVGNPGGPGSAGGDGVGAGDGTDGVSATGAGLISSLKWVPFSSGDGSSGGIGTSGGGGGGGGAQQCFTCNNGGGNGGGAGGEGGEGGLGGQGGQGGFGSFAVFLANSSPTFTNCTFESRAGGSGGAGGAGGGGGAGGAGGQGGLACTSEIGAGGKGGNGGRGGRGGAGAGGPGGPSYCIYKVNSTPTIIAPTYVVGTPGSGGNGGLHATGGGNAPNGGTGLSGNTN